MKGEPGMHSRNRQTASERSREEYARRLHRVLAYIDQHLDEPIDLRRLAREAHFSPFHFHRIFSSQLGETVGGYLARRRLEQAAARLGSQPRLRVIAVALAVGFGSAEAFSRAFKKRFGCPPSEWKFRARDRSRKLRNLNQPVRKPDHAAASGIRYVHWMKPNSSTPFTVTVCRRPDVRIAYLRYQGPFGPSLGEFWRLRVYPWLVAQDLLGRPRYGISLDDPEVTAKGRCRYDAGVEVGPDFVPSAGTLTGMVAGGLYATTKFGGISAEFPRAWDRLLREWLPASGHQLDARPGFEFYPPEGEFDEKTGRLSCELFLPIAKL